jgi:hypothetical protein
VLDSSSSSVAQAKTSQVFRPLRELLHEAAPSISAGRSKQVASPGMQTQAKDAAKRIEGVAEDLFCKAKDAAGSITDGVRETIY